MATHTDLDEVWLVVSPQSPFKVGQQLLPEKDRYALVQLAIAGNNQLLAMNIEFGMPKPSYTIDTLDELHQQYPAHHFVLLMGEDNLVGLPHWKEATRLMEQHEIYVYPRTSASAAVITLRPGLRIVEAPLLDISATFIRECVRTGKSIRYLVPAAIEAQILSHQYWREE